MLLPKFSWIVRKKDAECDGRYICGPEGLLCWRYDIAYKPPERKGDIMKRHPAFLLGWLLAATVLLSLAGLTAEAVPADVVGANQLAVMGVHG